MAKANLKRYLQPVPLPTFGSGALLLLRLIVGAAFVFHGWGKIQSPWGWMGPQSPVPGFFQFLAALSEFGGGIAWILGLLTPLASLGIACTMTVAVNMHLLVRKDPFVNPTGGTSYEPALVYLGIAILLLALGPGRFSLDAKVFGERR
ncbi:DoxX family protein [Vitiosangium sp. GDMCC 1.1324]|uniref:DoxX family protein n=1 Tax=Vitiosangium sp. (strain GDMCC 1.1324) TaxID=2138576 RepID=UPI000D3ABE5B|nr:DoxX family protein [Vitiosangium sp. GDMCC 1.1324]PTL75680.1 DoxX family protein [Vitiosangium sp. GDMCC 1.1324]